MSSTHIVVLGDTLYSIAQQFGFKNWRSIFDHDSNAGLRALRPNPHVLHPGDLVQIPDVPKTITLEVPLDARTSIVRVPAGEQLFRLRVVDESRAPVANAKFSLAFDGGSRAGTTDDVGMLRESLPVSVRTVTLTVGTLTQDIEIGKLNPIGAGTADGGVSGAKGRLRNIGYFLSVIDGDPNAEFVETLKRFQTEQSLGATGVLDDATRARLQTIHGS